MAPRAAGTLVAIAVTMLAFDCAAQPIAEPEAPSPPSFEGYRSIITPALGGPGDDFGRPNDPGRGDGPSGLVSEDAWRRSGKPLYGDIYDPSTGRPAPPPPPPPSPEPVQEWW